MRTQLFGLQTRHTKVYGLALALALTLMASLAIDVDATTYIQTHAFDCKTLGGTPIDTSYALHNDSAAADMVALCAIPESSELPKQKIFATYVYGLDNHDTSQAAAMLCVSNYSTTGGSCGSMALSSVGVQDYTLIPSVSQFTSANASKFAYLWVRIPRKDVNSMSNFRGYKTFALP